MDYKLQSSSFFFFFVCCYNKWKKEDLNLGSPYEDNWAMSLSYKALGTSSSYLYSRYHS